MKIQNLDSQAVKSISEAETSSPVSPSLQGRDQAGHVYKYKSPDRTEEFSNREAYYKNLAEKLPENIRKARWDSLSPKKNKSSRKD